MRYATRIIVICGVQFLNTQTGPISSSQIQQGDILRASICITFEHGARARSVISTLSFEMSESLDGSLDSSARRITRPCGIRGDQGRME